jgi:glycogen synthase
MSIKRRIKMTPMRILLVSSRFLPHRGGLESVVYHLAREFHRRGHQVLVITNRYPRSLPPLEEIDGVKVMRLHFLLPKTIYLKTLRIDLWLAGVWYRFFTLRSLRAIIDQFQPDLINNHYLNEVAEFTGRCLSGHSTSIPWVISLHGGDVDGEPQLSTGNRYRFHRFAKQARRLTACSQFLAAQALAIEPALLGKIDVIHNGVDIPRFAANQPARPASPYCLAVGQLVPHKGFDLLIRAFAQVAGNYPSVELWIAGQGGQRRQLQTLIEENKLERRVRLLGRVDESEVASLMAGSLFVVVPSLKEPFGIVALEAMASGKTVLASRVGGLPEFLPCPPNRLVSPRHSEWVTALDDWLAGTLTNPLQTESNLRSARQYDWPLVADRYLQAYEQARAHG